MSNTNNHLTTSNGAPVGDNQNSMTAGSRGPTLIQDAIKFPDINHTQKRDPKTHLKNPTAVWDFWSLSPESLHQVTYLMGDRGLPATLRHMNGYGSHTFKWVNEDGEAVWVKYHF